MERQPSDARRVVEETLASPGQPLPAAVRSAMEPQFGWDFGRVRVHTDERAAEAADAIDSQAFTVGRHIVFGRGSWSPQTSGGRGVLAHELAHVIQQDGIQQDGTAGDPVRVGDVATAGNPAETEADTVSARIASGVRVHVAARTGHAVVQRQPRPGVVTGHLDRNRFNVLHLGRLTPIGNADPAYVFRQGASNSYRDEAGLVWELLPDEMNEFHQPPGAQKPYPNKKFLHRDSSGGSSEAIMRPDGTYITTGPLRGTYNFAHPEGVLGMVAHAIQDVAPHFVSDQYVEHPPLDPRQVDVDTYRQRFEEQIGPIGERRETNVTDPRDRTIVVETGVLWIQHGSGDVLVLAEATNGRLRFVRFIDRELQAEALRQGQARQPRGIQTIPAGPPHIFGVPDTVPRNAARR